MPFTEVQWPAGRIIRRPNISEYELLLLASCIMAYTDSARCIRPGELWQCNWLEETRTICSAVFDLKQKTVTTVLGFSKGKRSLLLVGLLIGSHDQAIGRTQMRLT